MKRAAQLVLEALTLSTPAGRIAVLGTFLAVAGLVPVSVFAEAPRMCFLSTIFGHPCPACGTVRAVSSALKGHVAEAWRYNANVAVVLPAIATMIAVDVRRIVRGMAVRPFCTGGSRPVGTSGT
jgi:hypothetical protein